MEVRLVVGLCNSGTRSPSSSPAAAAGDAARRQLHPSEYGTRPEFIAETWTLLMRGTEGEPVADARRAEDGHLHRRHRPARPRPGRPASSPSRRCFHAAATRRAPLADPAIVSAMPAPAVGDAQVDCLVRALGELDWPASRGLGLRAIATRRRSMVRRSLHGARLGGARSHRLHRLTTSHGALKPGRAWSRA
jgi:hypothetical protein